MLVLSRKEGQRIVIDDQVSIVISQIKGNRVRIGIEAPLHVHVQREEVRDRILSATDELGEQAAQPA